METSYYFVFLVLILIAVDAQFSAFFPSSGFDQGGEYSVVNSSNGGQPFISMFMRMFYRKS